MMNRTIQLEFWLAHVAIPPMISMIRPRKIRYMPVAPMAPASPMYTMPVMKKARPMTA
jgi:hypothetical protein